LNLPFTWPNNCQAAVSLSYDDGLIVHRDYVAPLLQQLGLRATFYVNLLASGVTRDYGVTDIVTSPGLWRELAQTGHELGNHSAFHPCRISEPEKFAWLDPAFDLRDYTPSRWWAEMRLANFTLQLLDGKTNRTFGNTCCNTTLGHGDSEMSLEPLIEKLFVAARGPMNNTIVNPRRVNLNALGHFTADGCTCESLQNHVRQAIAEGGWIIFMIHGVGTGPDSHRLHIDQDEHEKFLTWLADQTNQLWTAPLVDVAQHVRAAEQ